MNITNAAKELQEEIINWRRELHRIPELGFKLYKTSDFIKKELEKMNIPYKTIAETGICAVIHGNKDGKTIALRADMDALEIIEETGLPYASTNGCMHACGHDAHSAMLLGTAKILSQNKDLISGNVVLLFQPSEERDGGAAPMIAEGCLKDPKVDAIIGLHIGQLTGDMENGMVALKPGAAMASVDKFSVDVIGKGGHGAMPHQCVDPIVIAAEIITSLQKIVSRELNPLHPAVLTIGKIHGGTSFNIIPEKVSFEGTVRTLNNDDREYVQRRVIEICTSIGVVNRARVEVEYIKFYPVLINDEAFTMKFAESAKKIADKKKVRFLEEPIMGSEDMSYFLNEVPGTFFFLGSNNPDKGIIYPHHHPKFDVDEDVLWMGPALFVQGVLDFLNGEI